MTLSDLWRSFQLLWEALRSLIQAFIHRRLDYCNSALTGVAKVYLQKLQSVQNMAAGTVYLKWADVTTSAGSFQDGLDGLEVCS